MNHWGKNDRNHEYQDSNDSASTPYQYSYSLCNNLIKSHLTVKTKQSLTKYN